MVVEGIKKTITDYVCAIASNGGAEYAALTHTLMQPRMFAQIGVVGAIVLPWFAPRLAFVRSIIHYPFTIRVVSILRLVI